MRPGWKMLLNVCSRHLKTVKSQGSKLSQNCVIYIVKTVKYSIYHIAKFSFNKFVLCNMDGYTPLWRSLRACELALAMSGKEAFIA